MDPKETMSYKTEGGNFCQSVGGSGSLRGEGAWGVVGGLIKGAEAVCLFGRTDGQMEIPPLFYRTSSPSVPLPKKGSHSVG